MKDIFKNNSIYFIIVPLVLSIIGIVFILSTGQLSNGGNTNLYLKQILWICVGIVIAGFILSIDYYYIVETSFIYYILGLILLVITLVFGREVKGAKSWLGIGGLGIQASEFMKICYIIFYAKFLKNISKDEHTVSVFIRSLGVLFVPLVLVLLQPDMGTAIVYCSIFTFMSFMGFKDISILLNIIMIGIITALLMLAYTYYQFYYIIQAPESSSILDILLHPSTFFAIATILLLYATITFIIELIQPASWINKFTRASMVTGLAFLTMGIVSYVLKPYQWNRLLVFINPEFDRLGSGYNTIQSQIAIGAGGMFGQGLFKGSQNLRGFLPEKHTDFIFAIIAEETGFVGCFVVMALYAFYSYLIVKTINLAKDLEGAYIASGILAMFITHIGINIGMNIGVTPVTGLPLPFISYGGSFYLTCIMSSALLLNIYSRRFVH